MDLFETLQVMIQCSYISDLRHSPYRERARKEMARINLQPFSLREITDMAEYLYGERQDFANHGLAERFFAKRLDT